MIKSTENQAQAPISCLSGHPKPSLGKLRFDWPAFAKLWLALAWLGLAMSAQLCFAFWAWLGEAFS